MSATLADVIAWLHLQAGWFFLLGLAALTVVHWRLFQHDSALLDRAMLQRSPPMPTLRATPKVSLLVPAWNEADFIQRHIDSFKALRYPNKQLILCVGGTDNTYEIACRNQRDDIIVLEQQAGEGKQRALRRCLTHADGEIIYLTDSDCLLSDQTFETLIAPLIDGSETTTTGSSRPIVEQRRNPFIAQMWFREVYILCLWGDYTDGILGRNAALTRDVVRESGDFEAEVRTGTDFHLAKTLLRLGQRIRFVRESSIETVYTDTFDAYRRQQTRWLKNLVVHGRSFGVRQEILRGLMPTLIGIAMLVALPIGLFFSPLVLAGWLLVMLHMLLRRVSYVHIGSRLTGTPLSPAVLFGIPVFATIDLVVWASVALQYIDQKRLTHW